MESKLIDYRLYDPQNALFGKKSDKARLTTLHCSNSENCTAFAAGKCAVWHGLGTQCPYGERRAQTGFTQRAKKYRSWLKERKAEVVGIQQLLPLNKIARIGDYIFFPYPYWYLGGVDVPEKHKSGLFVSGDKYIPADIFTVDLFEQIVKSRPQALMGGEITSYQKEIVPKIIIETEEELPGFFSEWAAKYPDTANRYATRDHVGRKAYLVTVRAGATFPHKRGQIVWDGNHATIEKYEDFLLPVRDCENAKLVMTPSEETTIKITDNNQVTKETRFV